MFVLAGLFSTYFGRWFMLESIARLGAARTSVFQVTSPLFTVIIAWAFLGERLGLLKNHEGMSGRTVVGAALALAGIAIIIQR